MLSWLSCDRAKDRDVDRCRQRGGGHGEQGEVSWGGFEVRRPPTGSVLRRCPFAAGRVLRRTERAAKAMSGVAWCFCGRVDCLGSDDFCVMR